MDNAPSPHATHVALQRLLVQQPVQQPVQQRLRKTANIGDAR
jgi:hypothetical protein